MQTDTRVKAKRTPQNWRVDRDIVEVEIFGIGILANVIRDEKATQQAA